MRGGDARLQGGAGYLTGEEMKKLRYELTGGFDEKDLKSIHEQMLMVLWRAGYVELEPTPPVSEEKKDEETAPAQEKPQEPPPEELPAQEASGGFGASDPGEPRAARLG